MFNRLFRREKLDQGVEKSRSGFFGRIRTLLTAERPIDDDLWDELAQELELAAAEREEEAEAAAKVTTES